MRPLVAGRGFPGWEMVCSRLQGLHPAIMAGQCDTRDQDRVIPDRVPVLSLINKMEVKRWWHMTLPQHQGGRGR